MPAQIALPRPGTHPNAVAILRIRFYADEDYRACRAAPNLVWQAANGWPFILHTGALATERNIPLSPVSFLLLMLVFWHAFVTLFNY